MTNLNSDRPDPDDPLVQFLRTEYRAIVVQDLDVEWRCLAWIERKACGDSEPATEALCAGCPVRDECLVTALVVEDAAAIRGGLTREARAALFVAIERDAFVLDGWLRERAQQLHGVS